MNWFKYFFCLAIISIAIIGTATAGNNHHCEITEDDYYMPSYIFNDNIEMFEFKSIECSRADLYNKLFKNKIQLESNGNRSYNVLNYDIYFDWYNILTQDVLTDTNDKGEKFWYFGNREWNGTNTVKLVITEDNISHIDLDAVDLDITGIKINGSDVTEVPQPDTNSILTISLSNQSKIGDTIILEIDYKYVTMYNFAGFFLFPEGMYVGMSRKYTDSLGNEKKDSFFVEERLAYTMSEPQDARRWMPCNDDPNDKAFVSFAVKVPKGFRTASNGLLIDSVFESNAVTYIWKHKYLLTTYLMHAAASKYVEFNDWYKRVSNPNDSIPVIYFAWKKDFENQKIDWIHHNARYMVKNTVLQLETYSKLFGEYPFEKYGIDAVSPFYYGGMEHQTITTANRSWYIPSGDGGFAHELAHQWLGDLITCETWKDIWINEGGATWSEALWSEKQYNNYYKIMQDKRYGYLYSYWGYGGGLKEPPIYGIPIENLFNTPTTYYKASWVYHMLMELIGREKFFPILQQMLQLYAYDNMTTQEFIDFFKSQELDLPVPLDTYFDQWLMKRGHPVYFITSKADQAGADYDVTVKINQIQEGDNIPQVFEMPVNLLFFKDSVVKATKTIINNERTQVYTTTLSFIPDSVRIDSNKVLLQHAESIISVVEIKNQIENINLFPNPIISNAIGNIELPVDNYSEINIWIYDINGKMIEKVYDGNLGAGSYSFKFNTLEINPGVYLARIKFGNKYFNKPFTIIK